jgi:hypothetical protein
MIEGYIRLYSQYLKYRDIKKDSDVRAIQNALPSFLLRHFITSASTIHYPRFDYCSSLLRQCSIQRRRTTTEWRREGDENTYSDTKTPYKASIID